MNEKEEPKWIGELIDKINDAIEAHALTDGIGYRWREEEDDCFYIEAYLMPLEVMGGAEDGEVVVSGFTLDVQAVMEEFVVVEGVSWRSQPFKDHEGRYISIEGEYEGKGVVLDIMAEAPDDVDPTALLHRDGSISPK